MTSSHHDVTASQLAGGMLRPLWLVICPISHSGPHRPSRADFALLGSCHRSSTNGSWACVGIRGDERPPSPGRPRADPTGMCVVIYPACDLDGYQPARITVVGSAEVMEDGGVGRWHTGHHASRTVEFAIPMRLPTPRMTHTVDKDWNYRRDPDKHPAH